MNPRQLAEIRKEQASVVAALHGDFDKEIKQLQALIVDWDSRNNLAKEREQLDLDKERHTANVQLLAADVSMHEERLNTYSDELDVRAEKIKTREDEIILTQNSLEQRRAAIEAEAATQKANTASLQAALSSKLADVQERIDAVAAKEVLLNTQEAKLKAAMKQVGALVG
jgi:chromosome segregation ATPase